MLIVGIGGTHRAGSSSEAALRTVLTAAETRGAETRCFSAHQLELPMYGPEADGRTPAARELLDGIREADGIILASPGYHGTVSGLVKNALDYVEDLAEEPEAPYFDGRPVGCVAVAYGWQAAVNTLGTLRDIVHALRGWPAPYGAAINAASGAFAQGRCVDETVRESLDLVGDQVVWFAEAMR